MAGTSSEWTAGEMDKDWVPEESLSRLPQELVWDIVDLVPVDSRLSAALTCGTFFDYVCPRRHENQKREVPALEGEDLVNLLLLLERDDPGQFVCFGCQRLCTLGPDHEQFFRERRHQDCGGTVQKPSAGATQVWGQRLWEPITLELPALTWKPEAQGPELPFSTAHLVMRRHFHGESSGLPLECLSRRFSFVRFISLDGHAFVGDHFPLEQHRSGERSFTQPEVENWLAEQSRHRRDSQVALLGLASVQRWKFDHKYEAKIVNDELFVARTHRVTGPPVPAQKFVELVSSLGLPVCNHTRCYTVFQAPEDQRLCVPQLRGPSPSPSPEEAEKILCHREVRSCTLCLTDYMISIRGNEAEEDWSLELVTYHRLGSCRSPSEAAWACLEQRGSLGYRYEAGTDVGWNGSLGGVRRLWNEGDWMEDDQQAHWINEIGGCWDYFLW
ncbi:hypothetical protein ACJ41O_001052 [Fusarium nematophilum]